MKHTPGPWYLAADAENTMIAAEHGIQIAIWPPQGGTTEQCANARLIASAPDLLEALRHVLPHVGVGYSGKQRYDILEKARAAIAKATGGTE